MYMGKILTSCRPPLLSSQAGGQGHYALLTLSPAFGPLSPIMSGKDLCHDLGRKKVLCFWAVTLFCHSTFLIRDKALGQLR